MSVTLYSWQYCPFAQRTRIALAVKGVEHELVELDITKKPYPDWFMALSPNGKVPTLVHDGRPLYESEVVSEYIDEVFNGPALLPTDPYQKAISRLIIAYGSEKFVPLLYRLLRNQDAEKDAELIAESLDAWRWVDARLREFGTGEELLFDRPTLADYSFGPFFQRWRTVEYYRHFELPDDPEFVDFH
jgi:glutathione S-transferase